MLYTTRQLQERYGINASDERSLEYTLLVLLTRNYYTEHLSRIANVHFKIRQKNFIKFVIGLIAVISSYLLFLFFPPKGANTYRLL